MYKLIWKKEVIDEVDDKEEADMLLQEYNLAYKGGVTMQYQENVEVNKCRNCSEEIDLEENGWFCSKSCYQDYAHDMFND
ncbi:MAG: hypothetical protein Unbinned2819contig1004_13 [Prokaryotic dsDNA virus sp.]|nr:MAG: hypothetical protein Unbinned2819contig1004_13 [Prokaryotic dsDNA virus sp.]|tara:strand:+ start:1537 stop:1776 length:240 start_codon:yes stop_codon:yes gene_type:complete